jgi:GTP cyclohydrolase I
MVAQPGWSLKVSVRKEKDKVEEEVAKILLELGEDLEREGLIKTPLRVAKSLRFLTSGYHEDLEHVVNSAIFEADINEMVIVKNVELYSLCEHHLLPFFGKCHVAYIPNGRIIGLSKIPRIINIFARRLQTQEQLTQQIAQAIYSATGAQGVGVVLECKHLCMMMRGVEKQESSVSTSVTLGKIRDDAATRTDFLKLVAGK